MSKFIFLILFFVNTFASVRINVPSDWFQFTPKKLFNKQIRIYAPKSKKEKGIKVTHQVNKYKPFYQDPERERFYQCQTNAKTLKTRFEEYTINSINICYLKDKAMALIVIPNKKEFHTFKFSNFKSSKEVKLFFKGLSHEK